ncbi:unnamed protein product [Mytilus edulis]|uniref:F-box domain-containing protein n=1 Tax=Mytilus edulis TaxID=6550 RepID=A0A8S3V207_MYTED|nr:unnamed protein product [Mytilus edulis]
MILLLPVEILFQILRFVAVKDLAILRGVCKYLHETVFEGSLLKRFVVNDSITFTDSDLSNILMYANQLETLSLFRCSQITGEFTENLVLDKFVSLRVLNVAHTNINDKALCDILKNTHNLRCLWINDCPNINDKSVNTICSLSFLEEMYIGHTYLEDVTGLTTDGLFQIVANCSGIKRLNVEQFVLSGNEFIRLVKTGSNLRVLDVSGSDICDEDMTVATEYLTKMEVLFLINCRVTELKKKTSSKTNSYIINSQRS